MRFTSIAVLLGTLALLACPRLPPVLPTTLILLVPLPFLLQKTRLRRASRAWAYLCVSIAAFLWAGWRVHAVLEPSLAPALEGQTLRVTGQVAGLPERSPDKLRFELHDLVLQEADAHAAPLLERARLSWYGQPPSLRPGEYWQLHVRLKRPRGFMNPGGFDYESWLFQRRLRATGYVREHPLNRRLDRPPGRLVDRWRQRLAVQLHERLAGTPASALMRALGIGDRSRLSQDQWNVLRRTGTGHLLAISGLHIGLVAGGAAWLGGRLWGRLGEAAALRMAAPRFGLLLALPAAAVYALLAGFSLPTRRALLMLIVTVAVLLLRRRAALGDVLALALTVLLCVDPLAPLAASFWLSFVAVAALIFGLGPRMPDSLWAGWGRTQWIASLALLPLLLFWFQQYPLVAVPANLVAVPWIALLVLPATLFGLALLPMWPALAEWPLRMAALALEALWPFLECLARLEPLQPGRASFPALALGTCAMVFVLLPVSARLRALAACGLLPLMAPADRLPRHGELRLAMLDVGQGLSIVARTRRHTLVYDTGARFSERFSAVEAVLIPYLRARGVRRLDGLTLSHGDEDHAGGARILLDRIATAAIYASDPEQLVLPEARPCLSGRAWIWDGVRFEFLHPAPDEELSGNDASCVLKITAGGRSVLLAGDIEAPAERRLLAVHGRRLLADVLVVPHHGSDTSSIPAFVTSVAPRHALVSVGYRNRFRLPKQDIMRRYARAGARIWTTVEMGAIEVRLHSGRVQVSGYRPRNRRPWHDTAPARTGGDDRWGANTGL